MTAYDKRAPTPDMHWIDYGRGGPDGGALSLVEDGENLSASIAGSPSGVN